MRRILLYAIVMAGLIQSAHAQEKNYTILEVDGEKIPSSEALDAWKSLFPEGVAPEFEGFDEDIRQNVLRGLVSERLLYKEAETKGVPQRADVQRRLRNLEKQITIQAYIEDLANSFVTEKSIKQAYDEYVSKAKGEEEVRARHILLSNQEEADDVIAKLAAGKDFTMLAKTMSTDKGSAARGGDLDYFTKDKMVDAFADAAFDLKPGETSKPVKTDFGWHVIKVEDRRPVKVKSFEEMQEQLKADLRKKGIEHHVDQLMQTAKVKYFTPDGKAQKLELK